MNKSVGKLLLLPLLLTAALSLWCTPAQALPYDSTSPAGNNSVELGYVQSYMDANPSLYQGTTKYLIEKIADVNLSDPDQDGWATSPDGKFSISPPNYLDFQYGAWESLLDPVFFMVVKASGLLDLYVYDSASGAMAGSWDITGTIGHNTSHVSFYGLIGRQNPPDEVPAVPEPGTLVLLSCGLVALFWLRRKA